MERGHFDKQKARVVKARLQEEEVQGGGKKVCGIQTVRREEDWRNAMEGQSPGNPGDSLVTRPAIKG